jgi:hypothetical protein
VPEFKSPLLVMSAGIRFDKQNSPIGGHFQALLLGNARPY